MLEENLKQLKQASMDYIMISLKYYDALRNLILLNEPFELSFSDIMNSPLYLSEKTVEETMEKLKRFVKEFGYTCSLEKKENMSFIMFKKLDAQN